MKNKDAKLLSLLRCQGRIPLTKLSRKTGLPVSTIHEKLKKYCARGLIRHGLIFDFAKLGFATRAFIMLAVPPDQKVELLDHMKNSQCVNSLFRINNGWSCIVECVFKDMFTLEDFIEKIENRFIVKRKDVSYVLDELKREGFLDEPALAATVLN